MEQIPYEINHYEQYVNSIIMIPNKDNKLNSFYKIIQSTKTYFFVKKMKCETKLVNPTDNIDNSDNSNNNEYNVPTKIYEVYISSEFENDILKRVKKTSIGNKYPIIICSVVQYEV